MAGPVIRQLGQTAAGEAVAEITLRAGDLSAKVMTLGAALTDLRFGDLPYSLTLGSARLQDFASAMRYHGTLVGPLANRISTARVRIGGVDYPLERNEASGAHLHSGSTGLHGRVWRIGAVSDTAVSLHLTLPDGACGLPGHRQITARFEIGSDDSLSLDLTASTDAPTLMNIANHSFWNLDGSPDFRGHRLKIAAERYLPVTPENAPTGEIADVTGTAMDFRTVRDIAPAAPLLDHNFCLSECDMPLRDVLWLTGQSGLEMTLGTTAPGLQIYDGRSTQRPGRRTYEGLAIEPQAWPDAPNHAGFPSIAITPGHGFAQTTCWCFRHRAQA